MKTGNYLDHLTDELEEFISGSFIHEFVSGGPKNYALSVFCLSTGKYTTRSKVKHSKVANFTTLRDMIQRHTTPVHVHNPKKIKRIHGGVSEPETKE